MQNRTRLLWICLFLIAAFVLHTTASALTLVDDAISRDAVWTPQQGPYRITNDIRLRQGVTLTIEAGTVVEVAPAKTFTIDGRLVAIGTEESPITFTRAASEPWGQLYFTDFSDDGVVDGDLNYVGGSVLQHCIIEYGRGIFCRFGGPLIANCTIRNNVSSGIRVEHAGLVIADNLIYENSTELDPAAGNGAGIIVYTDKPTTIVRNVVRNNRSIDGRYGGGGICAYSNGDISVVVAENSVFNNYSSTHSGGIFAYNATVRGNWVVGNRCEQRGGGINVIDCEVTGNLVDSNQANGGGGIYAENSTLSRNSIVRNRSGTSYGGGIYFFGSGAIRQNTVMHNLSDDPSQSAGIYVSGDPALSYNTIYANRGYGLYTGNPSHSPLLDARNNYWGPVGGDAINAALYDWFDDDERGLVDYAGPLERADAQAPPPPPTALTAATTGRDLIVRWARGSGQDGLRYTVHFGTEPGFPLENSVDADASGTHVLQDLEPGAAYYISVTARRDGSADGGTKWMDHSGHSEQLAVRRAGRASKALAKPENRSPAAGTSAVSLEPALSASAFSGTGEEGMSASRWQIVPATDGAAASGYGMPVFDSGTVEVPENRLKVPAGVLEHGRQYAWRVSYRNADGHWSPWSAETEFTTVQRPASSRGGPVLSDTTWALADSPYTLNGNALVSEGVTLTVEPGVTVNLGPGVSFMVRGKLVAIGSAEKPITFTKGTDAAWGTFIFTDTSSDAAFDEDGRFLDGSILKHCVLEHGRGLLIEAASPFVSNSDIRHHEASGITIRKGGPVIEGNRIVENRSEREGGGIYVYTNDVVRIRDNVIEGNHAGADGGGIFAYGYRSTTAIKIHTNTLSNNEAQGNGGGIYASRATIAGNTFRGNLAADGGGGAYTTFSIVDRNTFEANTADEGGGIYAERNSTITHNKVRANTAASPRGGGVYINYWGRSVENEEFSFNEVTGNRAASSNANGGVFLNGVLIFEKNNIFDNTGYALYNANPADMDPLEAKECYWGSPDREGVEKAIFHNPDDQNLAVVAYEPFAPERREDL